MSKQNSEAIPLTHEALRQAVAGSAAAFRSVTEYQPAGGRGDKVFPPTYEGGKYATENRRINEKNVPCVLLDSVQSQANRMEMALLDAWERKQIPLPVISVDFGGNNLPKSLRVTSLEAPHRIADALLRDSVLNGKEFRDSDVGKQLDHVDNRNATPLFQFCPTALIFGMWDSTGPRGGLGAKFARAMVSEIVGIDVQPGIRTSSRLDPTQIVLNAGPLYQRERGGWTLDEKVASKDKNVAKKLGKDGKPSEANHGNVTPDIVYRRDKNKNLILDSADNPIPIGGFTLTVAQQTTVLSLPALRRLRFPINGAFNNEVDEAARAVLAALALCAAALLQEQGCDLRSRCHLVAEGAYRWELIGKPGEHPQYFSVTASNAIGIYKDALEQAKKVKLPWMNEELKLTPSAELLALVRKSQELTAQIGIEEGVE